VPAPPSRRNNLSESSLRHSSREAIGRTSDTPLGIAETPSVHHANRSGISIELGYLMVRRLCPEADARSSGTRSCASR
jgi:hypothetical protein